MIKLIASDLDGTILLNGAQSVDASLIKTIDRIVDMGYIFAPASGRQINSLRTLFSSIADKLMYIGENGALVKYKGNTIVKNAMNKDLALEIIEDVMKQPNCEVLISGEEFRMYIFQSRIFVHQNHCKPRKPTLLCLFFFEN